MFTNYMFFESILPVLVAKFDPLDMVNLATPLEQFIRALDDFKSFIKTIIPPLLIISGLSTGVRS